MAFIQRTGQATILRSDRLPVIDIQIDPEFKYVGSTSFILYEVAHVEQHHFVVADPERCVERLLWFQFEGYLENNDHRYQYSGMDTMTLNGLTFLHDADVLNIDDDYAERPTSDSAHVVDYLKDRGYTLQGDTMFKRLVWLDADLRNELMIIYSENLSLSGLRISDLNRGGFDVDRWNSISVDLHTRALESLAVE
jgi:hypothetical protein